MQENKYLDNLIKILFPNNQQNCSSETSKERYNTECKTKMEDRYVN